MNHLVEPPEVGDIIVIDSSSGHIKDLTAGELLIVEVRGYYPGGEGWGTTVQVIETERQFYVSLHEEAPWWRIVSKGVTA